jgi:hypothetical protein
MRATYRRWGARLYKIRGDEVLEINLECGGLGVIGLVYADSPPLNMPNDRAEPIKKAEFERYYAEAMEKITGMMEPQRNTKGHEENPKKSL